MMGQSLNQGLDIRGGLRQERQFATGDREDPAGVRGDGHRQPMRLERDRARAAVREPRSRGVLEAKGVVDETIRGLGGVVTIDGHDRFTAV
jgi:hypothetical protein